MTSILVLEDDPLIGQALKLWLEKEHSVRWVSTLAAARSALDVAEFEIVVLDLGLPDGHGLDLLRYLKRSKLSSGVLILTASGDVDSRIIGLDLGADDYLVKPVDFKELDARIRSVKRRKDGLNSAIIEHGNLRFDVHGKSLTHTDVPVHLSNKEVSILSILLCGRDRYYSKAMLEERLYSEGEEYEGNAIEVHISSLRKKLGKTLIKTTRGLGYIIEKSSAHD